MTDGADLLDRVAERGERPVDVYDDLPGLYDLVHAHEEEYDALAGIVADAAPPGAERVLDGGCGTGRLLARLDARYGTAVGVDRSAAMLDVAAERTDAPLRRADLTEYVADDPFDVVAVFGNALADFVDGADLRALFARASENLREGGALVCDFLPRSGFENGSVERDAFRADDLRVARTVVSTLEGEDGIVRFSFAYELVGADGRTARTGESRRGRVFDPDDLIAAAERAGFDATVRDGPDGTAVLVAER